MRRAVRRVVILGGGYAGVRVARDLGRAIKRGAALEVILVSDTAFHVDTPALYEVGTAFLARESTLSTEAIAASAQVELATIFGDLPVTLHIQAVRDILPTERLLAFTDGSTLSFDTLVVTLGASLATYGVRGIAEHAFSIKDLHGAIELRHHVVRQFMMAKTLPPASQRQQLSFVVAGAGAAGVETVAELQGAIRQLCLKYGIARDVPQVTLVEASSTILPIVPERLRRYAHAHLEHLGITIRLSRAITAIEHDHVVLTDGSLVPATTTVWTGGLRVHPVLVGSTLPLARWGVACAATLQVVGYPNIFVAGDSAILVDYPEKIPGAVPVAYSQGKVVAANILRQLAGEALQPYRYHSIGALITLGGKSALALLPGGRGAVGFGPWLLKKIVMLRYWATYLSWYQAFVFWRRSVALHNQND